MLIESMEQVVGNEVRAFKQRTLTVSERHQEREMTRGVWVPELRLQGLWLKRAGFEAGARVVVDYVDDKLVISLSPGQPVCLKEAG
ncbi:type I toxin-antitoxin system SymE family toxin [Parachryseolinea silvisoli]|uniref:type I toxin-antitoxin system SymE family toxin n=1 Tax=Parachryseolinea silvisoli TaxID=2873601 RepID=UPI0022657FA0|nr:type I toxin-antitoxin system SymE family toxin [Parachryseolinea silvisoli]MCD9015187.1 type I toxin-antitoxin system SymE family toxin [Parachryseolinea silvisoli]